MSEAPALILLAFAHEQDNPSPPYRNLLKEQLQVQTLLTSALREVELRIISKATVERIHEQLRLDGDRLIGFHLASDVGTLIEAREGKRRSFERALRGRLGRFLGSRPQLRWIFLNGDGSQEQAEALLSAGAPMVLRTHNLCNDDAAFRLAFFFYQSLGQGVSLGAAARGALAEVRKDYANKAKLTYNQDLPSGYGSVYRHGVCISSAQIRSEASQLSQKENIHPSLIGAFKRSMRGRPVSGPLLSAGRSSSASMKSFFSQRGRPFLSSLERAGSGRVA